METMVNESKFQIELRQYEAINDLQTLGLIKEDEESGWGKLTDAGSDAVVRAIKDYYGDFLEDKNLHLQTVQWLIYHPEKIGSATYTLMLLSLR